MFRPKGARSTLRRGIILGVLCGLFVAFFFLAPVVPKTVSIYSLYPDGCGTGLMAHPLMTVYTSVSYFLIGHGLIYLPTDGSIHWHLGVPHYVCSNGEAYG